MGLDMYFATTAEAEEDTLLYYFRKHSDLHGHLATVWSRMTGQPMDEFDYEPLRITKKILDDLKTYVENGQYVRYEGFFWGASTAEQWEQTRTELIPKIEAALAERKPVYYYPSW